MAWRLLSLLLCFLLLACGNTARMGDGPGAPVGFINRSGVSDQVLWAQWQQAQQAIAATGVQLNPLQKGAAPVQVRNREALQVNPQAVTVIAVPDLPVSQLPPEYAASGMSDPSGTITCSDCLYFYVHSYVELGREPVVYTAASLAAVTCEYEFENIILHTLGYDVRWR